MTHPKLACLTFLALATVPDLRAADGAPPSFQVSTDLVELDVSVREPDGRPVSGLGLSDLAVYEDGGPRPAGSCSGRRSRFRWC